jgi:hypothetical protein
LVGDFRDLGLGFSGEIEATEALSSTAGGTLPLRERSSKVLDIPFPLIVRILALRLLVHKIDMNFST